MNDDQTYCYLDLPFPTDCTDITFFLLPDSPVGPGFGGEPISFLVFVIFTIPLFAALLSFALPTEGDPEWQILGAIAPEKPSAIFRTGWTTNESMIGCELVRLRVTVEPYVTRFLL